MMRLCVRIGVALSITLALVLASLPARAQSPAADSPISGKREYSVSPRHFPNPLKPYAPIRVAEPLFTNSPRVEQLIRDGKMSLSLQDAIALALENNLDISLQRYTPWLAQTDVLRNRASSSTGLLRFDPTFTSTLLWDRRSIPINNPFLAGTGTATQTALTNQTSRGNFGYSQGFPTGTGFSVAFDNSRSSTTSLSTFLNPSVQSSILLSWSQQLLNGFGSLANTRFLRIAKNNLRVADLTFANQVILTVSQVQDLYWDLVFAREDVRVKERSVQLAQKLYSDNTRQVEIGTLAPIEVVRAEAEVARTRQDLIVAQTFLLQQQMFMRNALTKNPMDSTVLTVEIVPTDKIADAAAAEIIPLPDAVKEAWENRPDVKQSRIDLDSAGIGVRASRNALLPSLTLSGQYGTTGLSGNSNLFGASTTVAGSQIVDAAGLPVAGLFTPRTLTPLTGIAQAGWSDALGTAFQSNFPTYNVQLTLSIPLWNRAAQADSARAMLEQRLSQTRLRQLENNIVVEVRNAQIALEQSTARVEAAQKARELADRTLDAEQKKYQLGASTIFFVIQAQRDLAAAQSVEVRSLADLRKARVEFDRALGRTLATHKIDIAAAKKGRVERELHIPGALAAEVFPTREKH